jgi:pimeloyl-ACP methyl ester carboxylesterase
MPPPSLIIRISIALLAAGLGSGARADRSVTIGEGGQALSATVTAPGRLTSDVAILIVSGSGVEEQIGRLSTSPVPPANFAALADGLAAKGVVSLRYDDRTPAGAAPVSGPPKLDLAAYVARAVAWEEFLAKQPGVRCVVMVGHGQGSLIAIMAAAKVRPCGLVSISGSGRSALSASTDRMQGLAGPERADATEALNALSRGENPKVATPALGEFPAAAKAFLASWLSIDPANEIRAVRCPTIILFGTADKEADGVDASRLFDARQDATKIMVDGMNHAMEATGAPSGDAARQGDNKMSIEPDVIEKVANLVRQLS